MDRIAVIAELARRLPEPALLVTGDGLVIAASPACREIFGPEILEGRALAEYVATPSADVAEFLALSARSRQVVVGGLHVTVQGSLVPYRAEGFLLERATAESPALVLIRLRPRSEATRRFIELSTQIERLQSEILRRHAVEDELRASEAFARGVLESSIDCIKVLDLEGRLLSMNRAGQRALQIEDLTPYLQSSWVDLWDGPDREAAAAAVASAARGGIGKFTGHFHPQTGESRWWDVVVTPIPGADGRTRRLLAISRDISEQRQAQEERAEVLRRERAARAQAEASSRLKDEFLAVLSHELRTPLNAILGWARLLQHGDCPADRFAHAVIAIERNARAQAELIESLLDLSSIVTGKLRLEPEPLDLRELVPGAIEAVRLSADAKGIVIDVRLPASPVIVLGDDDRLRQVLWNLLSNSVKFTPPGGRIELEVAHADEHEVLIRVTDTGEGISAGFLPHVFDRFRQADSTSTRRYGGLGLGLAITRELVEAHGGFVSAESAGEGLGARFTVHLPLPALSGERGHPALAPETSGDQSSTGILRGLRVLVVDDDPDTRELVALALSRFGAAVTSAASVDEALHVLGTGHPPDVLLADIGLPERDGYALVRELREHGQEPRLPAIALTAYASLADRQRAFAAGFDLHIAKPFEAEALAHSILSLVSGGQPSH